MTPTRDTTAQGLGRADRTGILAMWSANGISTLGGQMTNVAIPWFILETTGSAARTGLVATAITLGGVLAAVFSGPVIDRLGFKRSSVITDVGAAVGVAAIPLLHAAGALQFWQILVLGFLIAGMQAPGDTARYSIMPGLARRAALTIERANAVDRAITRGAMLVGPIVGGVLIAIVGPANVLYVQAVAFVVSALLVAALVRPGSHEEGGAAPVQAGRHYWAELLVGLRFVRRNSLLVSIVLVVSVANALDASLVTVVLPVYARDVWDSPTSLGALTSAIGAGSLIGAALFGVIGHRMPRRLTMLLGGAVGALLLYGGLALTPPLGLMIVLVLLGGVVAGPIVPLLFTVVQTVTPAELYGRVFGALQSLSSAAAPFVIAVVGFVVEGAGLVPTIVGLGVLYLAVTLGMLLNPALRRLDDDRTPAAPALVADQSAADRSERVS
ncbi:MFS transporter [Geodermatophilus sp. SYSU D00766]